jgi:hypothetical protein
VVDRQGGLGDRKDAEFDFVQASSPTTTERLAAISAAAPAVTVGKKRDVAQLQNVTKLPHSPSPFPREEEERRAASENIIPISQTRLSTRPLPVFSVVCGVRAQAGRQSAERSLLDLVLEVLARDQVGDVVVVLVFLVLAALGLLHGLVALCQLSERGEGVGAKLVQDAGNELGELLVLAIAVDSEGVGWNCSVDCKMQLLAF